MFDNKLTTDLNTLGEFGLINHLTKDFKPKHKSTRLGIGDDAAVMDHQAKQTLVTTDLLVENIHFDLAYVPLKHLGYKSVVVNLSDIYAMNATPTQITISVAMSSRFSLEAVEDLFSGIYQACDQYDVDLVGGDTSSSFTGLLISGTAIGVAEKKDLVYRNTAKAGDLVCVSGDLGGAYIGLQILRRENEVFKSNPNVQPDFVGMDYALERQLKPEARKDVIEQLKALKIKPTSMIDISDGLASEIIHLTTQSKVGCNIYEEKIPIDPTVHQIALDLNLDPSVCALSGGEDYELLFSINPSDYEKVKGHPDITVIGHLTEDQSNYQLISANGSAIPLTAQGWDAFLNKRGTMPKKD